MMAPVRKAKLSRYPGSLPPAERWIQLVSMTGQGFNPTQAYFGPLAWVRQRANPGPECIVAFAT